MLPADIPAIAKATFLVLAALFPIVNPLGSAAIFLNLVGGTQKNFLNECGDVDARFCLDTDIRSGRGTPENGTSNRPGHLD